uniref:Uncharacterized protein n=1 Tax=Anopheles melas TaxID=34690 RepID=A0A182UGV0_9DIPT
MMNSRNANMFGAAPSGRNVAGPPLSPIDSVTELRDTLLRAAPSITLLLSMSSSSSSLPAAARSTLVSDSVTYRFRFWNSTFATFVLPTKLHERISLYDFPEGVPCTFLASDIGRQCGLPWGRTATSIPEPGVFVSVYGQ